MPIFSQSGTKLYGDPYEIPMKTIKTKMASLKPEVVLTMATHHLENKFERLELCFQGRPTQWHIDRG